MAASDKPDSDDALTQRLELLKRELEAGRIKFPPDRGTLEDLRAVRADESGKVIPETVSGQVRAMALAVQAIAEREEAKSVNLKYVQTEYFGFLEELMGDVAAIAEETSASPAKLAAFTKTQPALVKAVTKDVESIAADISSFWDTFEFVVQAHLCDYSGIKAVYGGDIFPSGGSSSACSAALYSDVLVLPDPIHRIASTLDSFVTSEELAASLIKHGLAALSLKPLVFADTDMPIAVFASGGHPDNEFHQRFLQTAAEADATMHLNTALGCELDSLDALGDFLVRLGDPAAIQSEAVAPERMLHGYGDANNLPTRIDDCLRFRDRTLAVNMGQGASDLLVQDALGRMAQANLMLLRSDLYQGMPLVDAPNSWQYLLWKYGYDASRSSSPNALAADAAVVNALIASESIAGEFFGRLTPEAVIGLRQEGALEDLRTILRDGLNEVFADSEVGDPKIARCVLENLRQALESHTASLDEHIKAGRRFLGIEVGGFTLATTIAVAAAAGGNYALSLLAVFGGQIGLPSARDLWSKGRDLVEQGKRLRRTPPGILISRSGR